MYFIVSGHFFSFGDKYIYVFSVPLFFVISGFLSKKETNLRAFWNKIWFNYAVPLLLISTINYSIGCFDLLIKGKLEFMTFVWFVRNVMFGLNAGFGVCWFVYTLILLKIIFQFCPNRNCFYLLTPLMLFFTYVYNHIDLTGYPFFLKEPNVFVCVFTAYPFFALGVFANQYRNLLNTYNKNGVIISLLFISLALLYLSGKCNDYVLMHKCGYGGNLLWFLMGGIAGSCFVFALSKLLRITSKSINIISIGTIIILGFHFYFINWIREILSESYLDYAFAAIILMLFIPIILLAEKYFPLIIGKYRSNH